MLLSNRVWLLPGDLGAGHLSVLIPSFPNISLETVSACTVGARIFQGPVPTDRRFVWFSAKILYRPCRLVGSCSISASGWLAALNKTDFKAPFHKGTTLRELIENFLLDNLHFLWISYAVLFSPPPSFLFRKPNVHIEPIDPILCLGFLIWKVRVWTRWVVFKCCSVNPPPGLGEVLGAAFFKATLLSSLLHWAFYIFPFELRTVENIGLDDLYSFWFRYSDCSPTTILLMKT